MKVLIGMATFNGRNITPTLNSLKNQTIENEVWIYDNEKRDRNLTDNGKFYPLTIADNPCYYFTCDDDIIYPPDYIERTIEAIEKHKCIVTYHGRRLRGLNRSYYRGHTALRCLDTFPQTMELDVCGTGVTAFRTDYFNPIGLHNAEDMRMSDLVFSLEAAKQGKKIMHIGHQAKWINFVPQPKGTTIYEMENKNEGRQIELANEIFKLKNK
jgi:glycosyltransferase involved in cell wall biosynthesis